MQVYYIAVLNENSISLASVIVYSIYIVGIAVMVSLLLAWLVLKYRRVAVGVGIGTYLPFKFFKWSIAFSPK